MPLEGQLAWAILLAVLIWDHRWAAADSCCLLTPKVTPNVSWSLPEVKDPSLPLTSCFCHWRNTTRPLITTVFGHKVLISLFSAVFWVSKQLTWQRNKNQLDFWQGWYCKSYTTLLAQLIKLNGQDYYRSIIVIGTLSEKTINRGEALIKAN